MEDADIVFINGLHLEEPTRELAEANVGDGRADRAARGPDDLGGRVHLRLLVPRVRGLPEPAPVDEPALREGLTPRSSRDELSEAGSRRRGDLSRRTSTRSPSASTRWTRPSATATADGPGRGPQAPHVPRLLPVLRPRVRMGGRRARSSRRTSPSRRRRRSSRLIEQIRAEDLPAIFGSEVFPSPVLEQIAAETGATYVDDLRDDDLPGEAGDPDHSYLGLMVFDFRTIVGALGGDPSAVRGGRRHEPRRAGATGGTALLMDELVGFERVTCRYGRDPVLVNVDLADRRGRVHRDRRALAGAGRARC